MRIDLTGILTLTLYWTVELLRVLDDILDEQKYFLYIITIRQLIIWTSLYYFILEMTQI